MELLELTGEVRGLLVAKTVGDLLDALATGQQLEGLLLPQIVEPSLGALPIRLGKKRCSCRSETLQRSARFFAL